MNTLYLECQMGAAGDMLMGALYALLEDKAGFLAAMNGLLPGVTVRAVPAETCGICGTRMEVLVHGQAEHSLDVAPGHVHDHHHDHPHDHGHDHHHHAAPADIDALLSGLPLPAPVVDNARAVYHRIAEAESRAHGLPMTEIHFHEVGTLDAVADVTGVCLAMHLLAPDAVYVSPIHLGSGQVRCAHGVVPVPAPATAFLLEGLPCYAGDIQGELCTPTGAALLAHFGQHFGPMPPMTLGRIGYGLGSKVFPAANCVRAFLGEQESGTDDVTELCCNLDDMTAEAMAFAGEALMDAGALDIAFTPAAMKKGRPGTMLTVLCRPADEKRTAQVILRHTATNGVRVRQCRRYVLETRSRTVETPYGPIRMKQAQGFGICREKPEYADVAAAARACGVPFQEVWEAALSTK